MSSAFFVSLLLLSLSQMVRQTDWWWSLVYPRPGRQLGKKANFNQWFAELESKTKKKKGKNGWKKSFRRWKRWKKVVSVGIINFLTSFPFWGFFLATHFFVHFRQLFFVLSFHIFRSLHYSLFIARFSIFTRRMQIAIGHCYFRLSREFPWLCSLPRTITVLHYNVCILGIGKEGSSPFQTGTTIYVRPITQRCL